MQYLNAEQVEYYKNKLRRLQRRLKASRDTGYSRIDNSDVSHLKKKIRDVKSTLKKKRPPKVKSEKRPKLYKRAKFLKKKIKEGMLTKDEMMGERIRVGRNGHGQKANMRDVKRNVKWMKTNSKRIQEYKNIMRLLEPGNPSAGNIEELRKVH